MTREEAIGIVVCMAYHTRPDEEDVEQAIEVLKQEPCGNAVSRKAVVEYIKASDADLGHDCEKEIVLGDILTMPSVKPVACIATVKFSKEDMQKLVNEKMKDIVVERKKGKWIRVDRNKVKCSECEITHLIAQYPHGAIDFCPNCGAEMESEE